MKCSFLIGIKRAGVSVKRVRFMKYVSLENKIVIFLDMKINANHLSSPIDILFSSTLHVNCTLLL